MQRLNNFLTACFVFVAGASAARALSPQISAADAPRATPRLLRQLQSGASEIRVLVGLADGTPSAHALLLHPDPAGEPARRVVRLAAQRRLAGAFPEQVFRTRHYYESFSIVAGVATAKGAVELANRPDVLWVELDGTKRLLQVTPQSAQLLIHSDQTNNLGYTGSGQSIAVLDTGVDYTISTLGGGGFPNAKVIGGTDTADKDSDPMDCEGHGTEVAGVVAGPTGVAPGARIVAVKVFSSQDPGNGTCKDQAFDSDILAGINYAVMNQAAFSIAAINLSLGGSFGDGADHGYCDATETPYATAIDTATAAGILVVTAGGNDGTINALSIPACISSAVSVGAVYPDSHSRVAWSDGSGGTQCVDQPVVPDQIACFSNSNTNLSLLAPGAFWTVADKGGFSSVFHGTSASTPAVSGAVALLKQARPDLTAAGLLGVLRSTGKPIQDPRDNVTTPRIDTLAAVQAAAGSFASFTGPGIPIPDGTGSATATVTISGFTGSIAGVQAWVEVDHSNPEQLQLTLVGPDGTSVVLQNATGLPQHPINAIYGKTEPTAQSLGVFQGRAANGIWTLRVEDLVSGVAGKIRNFSVTLVPALPVQAIPEAAPASVLPVVAHVFGTKLFFSDLRIYNPASAARPFSLYYVPAGQNGSSAVAVTQTIGPGRVLALNDVVTSLFGYEDTIGPMTVVGTDANFLATSRAYTRGDNGTFGLFVPSASNASGIAAGSATATANGLAKTSQFHTNVGFTEVSGSPVTVRIDLRDAAGVLLASTTRSADANTTFLITDVIRDQGLANTTNFRADFTVVSPVGRILPFATYVDDVTGDGSFQSAVAATPSSEDVIVPQSAHVTGANGDFFKTNLDVTNLDAQPVTLTVSLLPLLISGAAPTPRTYTLGPGQTLEKVDFLATEFGLADPSAAGLRIHPSAPARLAVSTRTYVEKFGGTFGYSVPGVPASTAIGSGVTATAIQIDQTTGLSGYRSNFGFTEVAGAPATVLVTVVSGDTGAVLGSSTYSVGPNATFQASVGDLLGTSATASNLYLQFLIQGGGGRILPYATAVDNKSGDAIYMPAQ